MKMFSKHMLQNEKYVTKDYHMVIFKPELKILNLLFKMKEIKIMSA